MIHLSLNLLVVVDPIDLFECQGVRGLRRELQAKCLLRIKIDDTGDYLDILGTLRRLKDAVKPDKRSRRVRRFARDMEGLLEGIYDRLEAHAMAKRPGLAKMLYAEVSGQADIPSLKRIDKACREYEVMEDKKSSRGSGSSGSYSSSGSYRSDSQRKDGRSSSYGFGGYKSYRDNKQPSGQPKEGSRDLSHIECHGCKLFGHYKNQCPNKTDK